MRTTLWVESIDEHFYEIGNSADLYYEMVTEENVVLNTHKYDIIQYDIRKILLTESDVFIIHKSNDKEESKFIMEFLTGKILEKKKLLEERWALKKAFKRTDNREIQNLIDRREKKLRDNYFSVRIENILETHSFSF